MNIYLRTDLDRELGALTKRFESDIRQDERIDVLADVIRFLCTSCRQGSFPFTDKLVSGLWHGPVDDDNTHECKADEVWVNVIGYMTPVQQRLLQKIDEAIRTGLLADKNLLLGIDEVELSVRVSVCLESAGCKTLGDVVKLSASDLMKTKNFGRKSLRELESLLEDYNLGLAKKR